MENSIVFDTCMQIRYNYDGCKKGMRPSGGRCVPAKGRMAQEGKGNNTGAKIAGGVLGAGALGAAIALPLTLGRKKKVIKGELVEEKSGALATSGGRGALTKREVVEAETGGEEAGALAKRRPFTPKAGAIVKRNLSAEDYIRAGSIPKGSKLAKRDSAAQLCFDSLSFVLSDRY